MVIISLSLIGSIEIVVFAASMKDVVSIAFIVISNGEVFIFVIVVASVETVVFSDSVEVIISFVVKSSVEVPVVNGFWDRLRR